MKRCPVLIREVNHLDSALLYVSRFRTAVDGGAHAGLWTSRLAARFSRVVAVEPWSPHVEELRARVPVAEVLQAALGAEEGRASLLPGGANDGQYHLAPGEEVRVTPLDSLGLQDVDFLKLDVEGYELHALRGAEATILTSRPVILFEENGLSLRYGVQDGEAGSWLEARGYRQVAALNKDQVWVSISREGSYDQRAGSVEESASTRRLRGRAAHPGPRGQAGRGVREEEALPRPGEGSAPKADARPGSPGHRIAGPSAPPVLVLGGGPEVWQEVEELEALLGRPWPGTVLAVNDVGALWPRRLDHWVSLHPEKFIRWLAVREAEVGTEDSRPVLWTRKGKSEADRVIQPWGSGGSGMLGVTVAREGLHARAVVLCGLPMTREPHFQESLEHPPGRVWAGAAAHVGAWEQNGKRMLGWVKSMRGKTREILGAPEQEWLEEIFTEEEHDER